MPPDDALAFPQGQTHSGFILGSKERIENPEPRLFGHSCPCVVTGDFDSSPCVFCGEGKCAPIGHRVNGVKDKVDQHLAQFRFISEYEHTAITFQLEVYVDIRRLGPILPAWPGDLA